MCKKSLLIGFIFFVSFLVSCNLSSTQRQASGGGDDGGGNKPIIPGEKYNPESKLYKKTVTGVAWGDNKLFALTKEGDLWEKSDFLSQWRSLTPSLNTNTRILDLVEIFNPATEKTEAKGILKNLSSSGFNVQPFDYSTGRFLDARFSSQNTPIKLLQHLTKDVIQEDFYLTVTSQGARRTFSLQNGYDWALFDIDDRPLLGNTEIIGGVSKEDGVGGFWIIGSIKEGAIKTYKSFSNLSRRTRVLTGLPEGNIIASGKTHIKFSETWAIAMDSGDIYAINPAEGIVDQILKVKGLGSNILINNFRYIDNHPIVTTNKGYYEIDGDKLVAPTLKTTDIASYKENGLDKMEIIEVYQLSNGKSYLATKDYGLWERDPVTKEWTGV